VRSQLELYGVPYVLDATLVRGLDYYSRTTFEFIAPFENANSALCGGGRYDGLVEAIGGPPTPGIGFGAGLERLQLALELEGITTEPAGIDVFLVTDESAPRAEVLAVLAELRRKGISADADYAGRSLKGQLTQAGRSRAHTVVVITERSASVRREGAAEQVVSLDELAATLSSE
jgi:histidyl-tRNA synthetase